MTTLEQTSVLIETPPPAEPVRERVEYIDGLRGLACLAVILFHGWIEAGYAFPYWWNPLSYGYLGVDLFLMLSGFCLFWPLVLRGKEPRIPSLKEFALRRARRILPPYYITLIALTAICLLSPAIAQRFFRVTFPDSATTLTSVAIHLTMLHNFFPQHISAFNPPYWSLALEVDLYLLFPLAVYLARRFGMRALIAFAFCVTVTYRVLIDHYIGGKAGWIAYGTSPSYVLAYAVIGKWLTFVLGMYVAHLVAKRQWKEKPLPYGALAIGLLLLGGIRAEKASQFDPWSDLLCAAGIFVFVVHVANPYNASQTTFGKLVRWPPLVWFGVMSFSVYLIHLPLLFALESLVGFQHFRVSVRLLLSFLVFLPCIIGLSYLYYRYCERPFMHKRPPARAQ